MTFSGAVKIGDLNDFIAPSQACVVSLEGGKLAQANDEEIGSVQLQPRGFQQTLPAAPGQAVKVSLHDCLACSGCVTSAETVLLQHQSAEELLQRLADPGWTVVVSLSPQSVAALAALHSLTAADCAARLAAYLRRLGAAAVFDIAAARQLALAEAAQEFVQRYRASRHGSAALQKAAAAAAAAGAAAAARPHGGVGAGQQTVDPMDVEGPPPPLAVHARAGEERGITKCSGDGAAAPLPMLASACPGWVCYAEKTHGSYVLPYIATGKSPQAVMGTLIKRRWCAAAGLPSGRVYHCAVMPCYDKKLEASREDFLLPGAQVAETDCVLATTELQQLLEQQQADLRGLTGTPLDTILPLCAGARPGQQHSCGNGVAAGSSFDDRSSRQDGAQGAATAAYHSSMPPGSGSGSGSSLTGAHAKGGLAAASSGSGGYLEYVFREAARQLFGRELPPGPLRMTVGRNADMREVSLEVPGVPGGPVLRFASAYGFRNIQGLMRRVKLGRGDYDYVEVMACPSGCLNGGGQPKPAGGQAPAQLLEQLEVLYAEAGSAVPPEQDLAVQQLYRDWVRGAPGSAAARQLLHTQYHKREKTVTATLADW